VRAREPDECGHVERDGVRVWWERFGDGDTTVVLVPAWSIVHSRCWKAQVHYLARHFRVVTFDPRGNGGSDRPPAAEAYDEAEFARDLVDVMDASGTERAVLVSLSLGAQRSLLVAAEHPERVLGLVFISPALPLAPGHPDRERWTARFDEDHGETEGWAKYNRHYWLAHHREFLEFFFAHVFTEPHSTKQIEDCVEWGLESDPETLVLTEHARGLAGREEALALCERLACPVLVIHGTDDAVRPVEVGREVAAVTGGRLMLMLGCGHCPQARKPVAVNLALREFAESCSRSGMDSRLAESRQA
jgi:pimeloyl-ACP methyl ester carboxylesterase